MAESRYGPTPTLTAVSFAAARCWLIAAWSMKPLSAPFH